MGAKMVLYGVSYRQLLSPLKLKLAKKIDAELTDQVILNIKETGDGEEKIKALYEELLNYENPKDYVFLLGLLDCVYCVSMWLAIPVTLFAMAGLLDYAICIPFLTYFFVDKL